MDTGTKDEYCPVRADKTHCVHWGDGLACCGCQAPGVCTCEDIQELCPYCEADMMRFVDD